MEGISKLGHKLSWLLGRQGEIVYDKSYPLPFSDTPSSIGKSSIILANQAKWRAHGLWGQAKFQGADSAPFAALASLPI